MFFFTSMDDVMSEIMTRLLDTPSERLRVLLKCFYQEKSAIPLSHSDGQIRVSQASNKLLGGYSGIIINIDIEQNLRVLDKASNIRIQKCHNNQKGGGP